MAITYSASTTRLVYTSTYANIFTHPDPTNCPVTSCTLMDSTCASSMTSSANFGMTTGSTPYAVDAK